MSKSILSAKHWTEPNFTENISIKDWKAILLDKDTFIICNGIGYELTAKRLGFGVVKISKVEAE